MVGPGVFRPLLIGLLDDVRPVAQTHDQFRDEFREAAHLAKCRLGPELDVAPLERQLLGVLRRQIAVGHALAFIVQRHDIAALRRMLLVIQIGEGLDRAGKTGMGSDIVDAPSGMPHLPPVAQRLDVICPGSNRHWEKPPTC